ncbi:hypothetical protein P1J78_19200 [Psychromarinibacter sp. C21-152]|uniref:Uncharacterized protein n=1 Tax=Psychromarinibacter sediminicola TaxID=3033385 RepID=A0AAE3TBB8_9RHOB|nr:hypothetical protein [Psychromarinibacter sediminicola]MDF0602874.1 hypothetical protein [Psychromarinibacter sediminicola]
MRSRRLGLAVGLLAGVIAIGYGIYLLGARQEVETAEPDPYRYGFLLIPMLALGGGWIVDWNGALAALLLAAAAVVALLAFGLTLPTLILAVLLGGAALVIMLPDLL